MLWPPLRKNMRLGASHYAAAISPPGKLFREAKLQYKLSDRVDKDWRLANGVPAMVSASLTHKI